MFGSNSRRRSGCANRTDQILLHAIEPLEQRRLLAAFANPGFETGDYTSYQTDGNDSIEQSGTIAETPTEGTNEALIQTTNASSGTSSTGTVVTVGALDTFLGTGTTLQSNASAFANGSAFKQTFPANAGSSLSFDTNFLTNESAAGTHPDQAFYFLLNGSTVVSSGSLGTPAAATLPTSATDPLFLTETGFSTTTLGSGLFTTNGNYTLGFVVLNAGDSTVDSGLLVDNIQSTFTPPETFVVTNTDDNGGVNPAVGAGTGTLRQAIVDSNANVGATNIIDFAIDSGLQTITPVAALPIITQSVVIDGTSQPGFDPSTNVPIIELDGESAGGTNGLSILGADAGHSTVRGLIINRFTNSGIYVDPTAGNTNNLIAGNYIGTDSTGTMPEANGDYGVFIANNDNTIGGTDAADRNVISGNDKSGIGFGNGTPSDNAVEGNYIGTDASGAVALGNAQAGIFVDTGTTGTIVGGDTPEARNIISGNGDAGVGILSTTGNFVQGNYIGTDVTGELPIPNVYGVFLSTADGNQIGGLLPGEGNLISASVKDGVSVDGSDNNKIQGNLIGTNAEGTAAIAGQFIGVHLTTASESTLIQNNVLSGNSELGVYLQGSSTDTTIKGNVVGADITGTTGIPNGQGGIVLEKSNSNTIGSGNIIAFNGRSGVTLTQGSKFNVITQNSIFSNVLLGIDLHDDGVTPNDANPKDADGGENDLQNFPVLTTAFSDGTHTLVNGMINSTPTQYETLEFFSNPTGDPSGFGEGRTFLGSTVVQTDANGDAAINVDLPVGVTPGQIITATATDFVLGDTSEFSNTTTVKLLTAPPEVSINDVTQDEGDSGSTAFTFTISLDSAFEMPITVNYATIDGTAASGSDYLPLSNSVLFKVGQTSKTITVNVIGDKAIEADEVFGVNLSLPAGALAVIDDGQGTGTIVNDDTPPPPPPTLSINDVTHNEQNSGTHTFTFTVTRSGDTSGTSDVFYSTSNVTATAGSDYTPIGLTPLHFDANQTTAQIVVNEQGDTTVEGDETFTVNLSSPTNATIADGTGVGTIVNDDAAPPPPPASGSVSVITDPCDSTKKAIEIDGTDNADTITVTKSGSSQGKAVVKINGVNKGTFSFSGSIVVYGKGGADNISIDSGITRSAYVWGGDGNDTINGGGGNDIIFGQGNDDSINGNNGRDILVGGDGTDKLNGGSGDDLLIAGDFKSAPSMSQLCSIQKEWTRTDKNYSARVKDLTNGGGYNTIKLNNTSLFSSTTLKDSLTGGADSDLFFVASTGDKITDKASGETAANVG